jgi:hypothetical protein
VYWNLSVRGTVRRLGPAECASHRLLRLLNSTADDRTEC